MVRFLMMEEYEFCLRAERVGFRHYALPVRLLGAWHALRVVTGKTIDPAW